jgi:predicted NAD/FAD-dependent oxidoreductase
VIRPGQIYESYGHSHRVPEPREQLDASGGCVNGEVYDRFARELWDDPDHTIVTGAARRLALRFPEFVGRMRSAGVRRWRYGIPRFYPGRIANYNATTASSGRIHFCGDYAIDLPASMEAASRSGVRVAQGVLAAV